jgi:hypothetical protein
MRIELPLKKSSNKNAAVPNDGADERRCDIVARGNADVANSGFPRPIMS